MSESSFLVVYTNKTRYSCIRFSFAREEPEMCLVCNYIGGLYSAEPKGDGTSKKATAASAPPKAAK
jgi:hypothetical protein